MESFSCYLFVSLGDAACASSDQYDSGDKESKLDVFDSPEQFPSTEFDEIEELEIDRQALEVAKVSQIRAKTVARLYQPSGHRSLNRCSIEASSVANLP